MDDLCRIFAENLDAANAACHWYGLPELDVEDAVCHYGDGGHDYNPELPDRGENDAAAFSRTHYGRWVICVLLFEGELPPPSPGNPESMELHAELDRVASAIVDTIAE